MIIFWYFPMTMLLFVTGIDSEVPARISYIKLEKSIVKENQKVFLLHLIALQ